jgi:5-methyltetrahydropteroyltriglutamate--homocysteine methyltransferase
MDADVITFEACRSEFRILDAIHDSGFETEVGPGVYDIHSPRIPSVDEIAAEIRGVLDKVSRDKLWINPDCGLKTRGVEEAEESLKNMILATDRVRKELQES